ncbi:MAG: M15 family metallopeptidase [Coriobacteriia bacterium]|nr:M15 family metallopeptidase [Coriobacteriia bacterium]
MGSTMRKMVLAILVPVFCLALCSCSAKPATVKSQDSVGAVSGSVSPTGSATPTITPLPEITVLPPVTVTPKVIDGFVRVTDLDSTLVIDLKYATTDNFTHQKVYPTAICVLRFATAEKLAKANAELAKMGYRLKIWDAYRPLSVQKIFWSIKPDANYVANPATGGSVHNRGCAVDVTLVDLNGDTVVMPSEFDDFTDKASPSNPNMSAQAKANLDVLRNAMKASGFVTITTEWWHFEDSDGRQYPVSDVDVAQFQ